MRWFPIVLTFLTLALGLIICGIIYIGVSERQAPPIKPVVTLPVPTPRPKPEVIPIEIKSTALIGGLNLVDITLDDAKKWASQGGVVTVKPYSGPLPTISPEMATIAGKIVLPKTASVVAGHLKSATNSSILVISQGTQDQTVIFDEKAKIWVSQKGKLQQYGQLLAIVTTPEYFSNLLSSYNWVVAVGITKFNGSLNSLGLLIFTN